MKNYAFFDIFGLYMYIFALLNAVVKLKKMSIRTVADSHKCLN
jgi:hypothetical protein